jgi:iron complex outermembrane recepter protein
MKNYGRIMFTALLCTAPLDSMFASDAPETQRPSAPAATPASATPSPAAPAASTTTPATAPVPEAASSSPNEAVERLDAFVVADVPVDQSVNPLVRPISSVLGEDLSILDTPRTVASISQELMNERGIDGLGPMLQYDPGAYQPARYGKEEVPNIRGDAADLYINGQRMSDNIYALFPSFNDVESVDIVSGPASAVYGAGYLTGGYVNFVTKQPNMDYEQGELTYRMGTLVSGGDSFFQSSWQLDISIPIINDKLAIRFSYEGKGGQTFYEKYGYYDDREDAFLAIVYQPNSKLKFDFNAQYFYQNSPESGGINRPWQGLINNGTYFTGLAPDGPGAPGVLTPTGTAKIEPNDGLFSASSGDSAMANSFHTQLITTDVLGPNLTLKNLTYFEDTSRRRYSAYEYIEYVPIDNTFENRTELHYDFDAKVGDLAVSNNVVTGVSFRYEERESFVNYYNEYVYNWDVTAPNANFDFAKDYPQAYTYGLLGPGGHYYFNDNNSYLDTPETTYSEVEEASVFYDHTIHFGDKWTFLAGVRGDTFWAFAKSPLLAPGEAPEWDHAVFFSPTVDASLTYKPLPWVTTYVTYDRVYAINGNTTGGGIDLYGNGNISAAEFKNLSTLYEAGAKFDLVKNTLFASADAFQQYRDRMQRETPGPLDLMVRGIEVMAVYQPTTRFYITTNASYSSSNFMNSAPFELGGASIYNYYAAGTGPNGLGNGVGPFGNQVPQGNYRVPGTSNFRYNGQVSYELKAGVGASFSYELQSPENGNLLDQFEIPWQHTLNVSLFYRQKSWQVNVDFQNITNQRNWEANGDTLMDNQLLTMDMPFNVSGYIKMRF